MRAAHQESYCSADARTIANIVTARGIPLSHYRAGRLMKELKLVSCQLPNHRYKKAHQTHVAIPNQLDRQFGVTRPNGVKYRSDQCCHYTSRKFRQLL